MYRTTISFIESDDADSFQLSLENQMIYEKASEWFEGNIRRKIDDTIQGLRADRFTIPWVHDLLYER